MQLEKLEKSRASLLHNSIQSLNSQHPSIDAQTRSDDSRDSNLSSFAEKTWCWDKVT